MKRIINDKKYDTETAQKIGEWCDFHEEDFSIVSYKESLYRKSNGEFFIYKEGMSYLGNDLAKNLNNIKPLKEDEAKRWILEAISVDLYEQIFGEVEE